MQVSVATYSSSCLTHTTPAIEEFMRILSTSILLTLLLISVTVAAGATTINFGLLSQPGTTYVFEGGSLTQEGFTFTSGSGNFYIWQESSANYPGPAPASTSLFDFFAGATDTISAGSSAFTLNSIDLAPLIAGGTGTFTVTFVGTLAGSGTVSQTFTVNDSPNTLQTFAFSGFTNVVSVSFVQGANIGFFGAQGTAYQFNNVLVNASSVPEPNTLALLGSGLAALAGVRRKFLG